MAKALSETHRESPGVRPLPLPYVEQEWGRDGMLREGGSCQGFTLRVLSEGKNKPENLGCLQVLKHF